MNRVEIDTEDFEPGEVACIIAAIHDAVTDEDMRLTPLQRTLLSPLVRAVTGTTGVNLGRIKPTTSERVEQVLMRHDVDTRRHLVQCAAIVLFAEQRVEYGPVEKCKQFAKLARVNEGMLEVAEELAEGDFSGAMEDFESAAHTSRWNPITDSRHLHTTQPLEHPWAPVVDDALAAKWESLKHAPEGSLGQCVYGFYQARGFKFPGEVGGVSPYLAEHDFVHVLMDYGTTVDSELEVFAAISFANPDATAFSHLVQVLHVFQTGLFERAAGFFEKSPGHLAEPGMASRLVDAVRRGISSRPTDLLDVDWFAYADRDCDDVREEFGIVAKSRNAVLSGSVGPFEQGGISEYQYEAGQKLAFEEGRVYDAFGAAFGDPSFEEQLAKADALDQADLAPLLLPDTPSL